MPQPGFGGSFDGPSVATLLCRAVRRWSLRSDGFSGSDDTHLEDRHEHAFGRGWHALARVSHALGRVSRTSCSRASRALPAVGWTGVRFAGWRTSLLAFRRRLSSGRIHNEGHAPALLYTETTRGVWLAEGSAGLVPLEGTNNRATLGGSLPCIRQQRAGVFRSWCCQPSSLQR